MLDVDNASQKVGGPMPIRTQLNTEHIVSTVKCKFNSQKCYSVDLFCVRMMSPVPCALSTMMLCLLKLMKHTGI